MTTKKVRVVGIGIGAIAAVLIAITVFSSVPQITQTIIPNVTVSGIASTIGSTTKPVSIDFTSDAGSINSANVGEDGTYSIILANQHSYSMAVHYSAGYGLTSGTCDAGVLSIYTSSPVMDRNISC
jgi:hypothetical protein